MGITGRIKQFIKDILYSFYLMGPAALLPLLVLWAVLPITAFTIIRMADASRIDDIFRNILQSIIPLFSVWWLMMYEREYIEGRGNEVLLIYRKNRLGVDFSLYIIYLLSAMLPIIYMMHQSTLDFSEWIRIALQSFCFVAWFELIAGLLGSVSAPVVMLLFYTMVCMLIIPQKHILSYMSSQDLGNASFWNKILPHLLTAIAVLFIAGRIRDRYPKLK